MDFRRVYDESASAIRAARRNLKLGAKRVIGCNFPLPGR